MNLSVHLRLEECLREDTVVFSVRDWDRVAAAAAAADADADADVSQVQHAPFDREPALVAALTVSIGLLCALCIGLVMRKTS